MRISVGVLDPGELMLMYGSTIFTIRIGSERIADARLWHAPWLFADQHASMAGLATSGTLAHWFADQLAQDLCPDAAMAALAAEAQASPPGANGLIFSSFFSGERTPLHDPNAKGAIVGLTLAHTRADLYRAALDGHRLRDPSTPTPRLARRPRQSSRSAEDCGTGSGRKPRPMSPDSTQTASEVSIGAAFGDAFLAQNSQSAMSRRSAIKQWNPAAFTIEPDPRNGRVYWRRYASFRKLYPRIRDLMAELGPGSDDAMSSTE